MAGPNANLPSGQELVVLPFGNDVPWYTFQIALAGVQYTFTVRYSTRSARWSLDILDASGMNLLVAGLPLLIGRDLTRQFRFNTTVPQGIFFCTDDTGSGTQPTRLSFGVDHTGWFLDPTATT